MRHPSLCMPVYCGKLWWATLLAYFLQTTLLILATSPDETTSSIIDDDNLQIEDVQKRDWNRNLNVWGKRAWNNLHGGWGLKRSAPSMLEPNVYSIPPIVQKRSWQNFQSGWGKRLASENKDAALEAIASMLEQNDHQTLLFESDNDLDTHKEEKRKNWVKFSDGWGKRNKWESFRGAWGKREPAWVNLKGLWGKRNEIDSYID